MRVVGLVRNGCGVALVAGFACVQACDSGSSTALRGSGAEAGDGHSTNGGSTNGGSGEQPSGGAGEQPSGGAGEQPSDGGTAMVQGGQSGGGDAGQGGAVTTPSDAGQGGTGEGGGSGGPSCDEIALSVEPRVSNVMFLIDRSGSMFVNQGEPWQAVRAAALPVIDAFDQSLDIGLLAMTGEIQMCPLFDEVAPAPDNYNAIASFYGALAAPLKGESPHMLGLERAADMLDGASGTGENFALLVIDGSPDWCNDGNLICPIDATVAKIQALRARDVTTLVAGLPLVSTDQTEAAAYAAALQAYANAGVGQPAAVGASSVANLYYQCQADSNWSSEFTLSGKTAPQALGSYSANPGSAPFVLLDPSDAEGLASGLATLFARAKSCRFDVQDFAIDVAQASSGTVTVNDESVPFDTDNGWRLVDDDELELVGTACAAWRVPTVQISVKFPCAAVSQ
jgi:hypothetical protein